MSWLRKFFSADNSEIGIKAGVSAGAFIIHSPSSEGARVRLANLQ
jgi:hypothetical protein